MGTLLAVWTAQAWLPTIQGLLLEKDGIKGAAAIPYVSWGMKLWGIGGIESPCRLANHRSPTSGTVRHDSPLERDGFEPLVPLRKGTASSETTLIDLRLLLLPEDQATPSRE